MSSLVMILTVAMMVPGNGPERASGEIAMPQPLDLKGQWWLTCGKDSYEISGEEIIRSWKLRDEGIGRFRMTVTIMKQDFLMLGIYRQEKEKILMCFRNADYGRPTRIQDCDGQFVVTLRRIKSRK